MTLIVRGWLCYEFRIMISNSTYTYIWISLRLFVLARFDWFGKFLCKPLIGCVERACTTHFFFCRSMIFGYNVLLHETIASLVNCFLFWSGRSSQVRSNDQRQSTDKSKLEGSRETSTRQFLSRGCDGRNSTERINSIHMNQYIQRQRMRRNEPAWFCAVLLWW